MNPAEHRAAQRAFTAEHPHPGDDPLARLRHTNRVHADTPAADIAVLATLGSYGPGVRTGLTHGDLRALEALVDRVERALGYYLTEDHSIGCGREDDCARCVAREVQAAIFGVLASTIPDNPPAE